MSTSEFFRSRLDAMIDLRHPLAVLAKRMPWASIEAALAPMFGRSAHEGRCSEVRDLFGVAPKLAGAGKSAAGRPQLPIRLLYLKHAYTQQPQPKTVLVVLGFRGVDALTPLVNLVHRGKHKTLTSTQRCWLKRRQVIEPIIGHEKQDPGMQCCWLKGQTGVSVS